MPWWAWFLAGVVTGGLAFCIGAMLWLVNS